MHPNSSVRSASVTGLAVVGFVALVIAGLWLALYLARSLTGSGGLGAVADYVGSLFAPAPTQLAVVPTASTTIPFPEASSTPATASTTPVATSTPSTPAKTVPQPVYYRSVETTYPVPGATRIPATNQSYSGLPDLIAKVVDVGYIDNNGTFVPTTTISSSQELAAEILVTNIGTNTSGPWDIQVTVPTSRDASFTHTETMSSLDPNQPTTIDLRLSEGHPRTGTNAITVTVDPAGKIAESNESNNSASATITVN